MHDLFSKEIFEGLSNLSRMTLARLLRSLSDAYVHELHRPSERFLNWLKLGCRQQSGLAYPQHEDLHQRKNRSAVI